MFCHVSVDKNIKDVFETLNLQTGFNDQVKAFMDDFKAQSYMPSRTLSRAVV